LILIKNNQLNILFEIVLSYSFFCLLKQNVHIWLEVLIEGFNIE
jgi:hypothetical protein